VKSGANIGIYFLPQKNNGKILILLHAMFSGKKLRRIDILSNLQTLKYITRLITKNNTINHEQRMFLFLVVGP